MRIVQYDSPFARQGEALDLSWQDLAARLETVRETDCAPCPGKSCREKFGPAWSPVDIHGSRKDDHVHALTALVFDLDGLSPDRLAIVDSALDGYAVILHSTHSHRPPNASCIRAVLPLSRPFERLPGESTDSFKARWHAFYLAAIDYLGLPVAEAKKQLGGVDTRCTDLSRLFFFPSVYRDGPRLAGSVPGRVLDVDALSGAVATEEIDAAEAVGPLPEPAAFDLGELRACLTKRKRFYSGSKRPGSTLREELLDCILQGKPLAAHGERADRIHRAACIVATAVPLDTPAEVAVELMRASIAAIGSDLATEGLAYWLDKARKSYEVTMRARRKRREQHEALRVAMLERLGGPATEPASDSAGEEESGADWRARLISNADGSLKACGFNVGLILEHAAEVRGTIRFNAVRKEINVFGGPFEHEPLQFLHVGVANWFQETLGLHLATHQVKDQIARISRLNSFDPLREYLTSLQWDTVPRLDTVFETHFGALTIDDEDGSDLRPYLRLISPKFFIAAVARALSPGEQVDHVLVLEGKQGIKKSKVFKILGGEYFTDASIKMNDKDSTMLAAQNWIIELAEIVAFKKSTEEEKKSFITRRADKIRPPYGAMLEDFPRRAVFVGTHNPKPGGDEGYLTDQTGARRYWPVKVVQPDVKAIARDRDQLWAEAVRRYYVAARPEDRREDSEGERWWPEGEAEDLLIEAQTTKRYRESPKVDLINQWWHALAPQARPSFVSTHEVALAVFPYERLDRALEGEIGHALHKLGFQRTRRRVNGHLTYVYVPSAALLAAPQGKATHLRLIANSIPTTAPKAGHS